MKNIKLIIIALILVFISSCENNEETEETANACAIIKQESFVQQFFPNAKEIQHKQLDQTFNPCQTTFSINGDRELILVTHVVGAGSEASLETGMQVFPNKQLLTNIGNKAYYIEKINQISIWKGQDLFHILVSTNKDDVIKVAKEIINKF